MKKFKILIAFVLFIPVIFLSGCEKTNLQLVNDYSKNSIKSIENTLNTMYVPTKEDFCIDCISEDNSVSEISAKIKQPNTESLWNYVTKKQSFFNFEPFFATNIPRIKIKINNNIDNTDNATSESLSNYFSKITNLHSQMNASYSQVDSLENAMDCVIIKKEIMQSRVKKLNQNKTEISNEICSSLKQLQSDINSCCECINKSNKALKSDVESVKKLKTNLSANADKLTGKYTKINSSLDGRIECLNNICEKLDSAINTLSNNTVKTEKVVFSEKPHYIEAHLIKTPRITTEEYIKKFEEAERIRKNQNTVNVSAETPSEPSQPNKHFIDVEIKKKRPRFV